MSIASAEEKVELYEHFFRDPRVGDGILQPPRAGIACRNIRKALCALGYQLADGDQYDDALVKAVQQFQADQAHQSCDGLIGRGTRKLLTQAIIARGEGFFRRGLISPEYAVFFSYSRHDDASDSGQIAAIYEGIQSCGIPIFRDKEAIPGGASWPDMLYRSVRKCQVFLCMLSAHSAGSINVLIEVALARHANRPIIPVLVEAVQLPDALQSLLGNLKYVNLFGKSAGDSGLGEVLEALSLHGLSQRSVGR